MIDATFVSKKKYTNNSIRSIYQISSVSTVTTSDEVRIPTSRASGTVFGLQVVTLASTDFDVSLREKSGVTPPTVYEILKREDNNLNWGESGIAIPFTNADNEDYLYFKLTNNDTSNVSGTVTLSLFINY